MTPITLIRDIVRTKLLAINPGSSARHREALLIKNGAYCGHRFTFGDFSAVWFIEEDELKVYTSDGSLIDSIKPSQILVDAPRSRAA